MKCCLNYELDTHLDALKDFPDFDTKLITENGDAICQKQDIFKGLMWFAYTASFANWHVLKIDQVKEIIAINKDKKRVSSLEDYAIEIVQEPETNFNNAMGQESLTRFDQPKKKKNKKKAPLIQGQGQNPNQGQPEKPNRTQQNPNQGPQHKQGEGQNPNTGQNQSQNKEEGNVQNPQNKRPIIIKKNEDKK